jgi:hypothetical protein
MAQPSPLEQGTAACVADLVLRSNATCVCVTDAECGGTSLILKNEEGFASAEEATEWMQAICGQHKAEVVSFELVTSITGRRGGVAELALHALASCPDDGGEVQLQSEEVPVSEALGFLGPSKRGTHAQLLLSGSEKTAAVARLCQVLQRLRPEFSLEIPVGADGAAVRYCSAEIPFDAQEGAGPDASQANSNANRQEETFHVREVPTRPPAIDCAPPAGAHLRQAHLIQPRPSGTARAGRCRLSLHGITPLHCWVRRRLCCATS